MAGKLTAFSRTEIASLHNADRAEFFPVGRAANLSPVCFVYKSEVRCEIHTSYRQRLAETEKYGENMPALTIMTHRMENVIYNATETDGPQIQEITARAGVFSEEEIDSVRVMWSEYLSFGSNESGYNFIVHREGAQVLGFAIYGYRDLAIGVYDLYWIAVDPGARRRSVGRDLITACESAVRENGGRMLVVETSGTPHYEPTRKFYLGMGYRDEAIIKDFYAPGDDLIVFIKRI